MQSWYIASDRSAFRHTYGPRAARLLCSCSSFVRSRKKTVPSVYAHRRSSDAGVLSTVWQKSMRGCKYCLVTMLFRLRLKNCKPALWRRSSSVKFESALAYGKVCLKYRTVTRCLPRRRNTSRTKALSCAFVVDLGRPEPGFRSPFQRLSQFNLSITSCTATAEKRPAGSSGFSTSRAISVAFKPWCK